MSKIVQASLATLPSYITDLFVAKHHSFIEYTAFDINNKNIQEELFYFKS